uniref:F-box domain-containing protein n=1 Tax=Anopheles atroparvus TaxID=41427 RepID=A0A182IQ31_ANOAO
LPPNGESVIRGRQESSRFHQPARTMNSILILPNEVLDHIFSYLITEDLKRSKLVCRRWYHQLTSPRYWKMMRLQLEPCRLTQGITDALVQDAEEGKYNCIELFDPTPNGLPSQESVESTVKLLEACGFSLYDLRLTDCSKSTLAIVSRTMGKMCRLQHLTVNSTVGKLPEIPRTFFESMELVYVTHLDVCLANEYAVELVSVLGPKLKYLTLRMIFKELLVRCLNEIHLPALHSLTVVNPVNSWILNGIGPGEFNDGCWRTLAQLETLRINNYSRIGRIVVDEMLEHCRNVKCLTIEHGTITNQGIDLIDELKGLKYLKLNLWKYFGGEDLVRKPVVQLPNLEHVHLLTAVGIRLGEQLPKLASVIIEGPDTYAHATELLSEVIQIDGIERRKLQKLLLKIVTLDWQTDAWLYILSIEELSLEGCRIMA